MKCSTEGYEIGKLDIMTGFDSQMHVSFHLDINTVC